MSDKKTRKELKQPDAFQKAGGEASAWLAENGRWVIGGVVGVMILGGGIALASYVGTRGEGRAAAELGTALEVLGRPVQTQPPSSAGGSEPKPFATQKEKDEATVKTLTEFRQTHRDGRASATAALSVGEAALRLDKYDEALSAFDAFLKAAPSETPLRATALEGRGYAFEGKGQLDEALAAYDQLAHDNKSEFMNGMGLYHRARILILQGKKDEAAKQLSEIPGAAPSSSAARLASERMALLASEGVHVPSVSTGADAGAT